MLREADLINRLKSCKPPLFLGLKTRFINYKLDCEDELLYKSIYVYVSIVGSFISPLEVDELYCRKKNDVAIFWSTFGFEDVVFPFRCNWTTCCIRRVLDARPKIRTFLGRPGLKWEGNVSADSVHLGEPDWRVGAQNRSQWRTIVDAAIGLQAL